MAGMLEKAGAFRRQRYAVGMAREQFYPELGLELLHGSGDRGLGDAELDRRMGDLAGIGRGDEIADLCQRKCHIGFNDIRQLIF